jgi:TPP-dependent pyruvate/acetoin dehydrogenase alpha subunit
MPGVTVDGHDFFAVHEAFGEIIERARNGGGPALLEHKLDRFFGHFEGDNQTYRAPGEVARNCARRRTASSVRAQGHRRRRHRAASCRPSTMKSRG